MPDAKPKPRKMPWVLGLTVLFLFTTLVVLQSSNYWRTLFEVTERDTVLLYALISLNFFAFVVFGFILLRSILKLMRERRALKLGAKIKTRLLVYFTLISILPIIAMAMFTYLFMNRALERWFTQIPETVAREAREIRDRSVEERTGQYAATARTLAATLRNQRIDDAFLNEIATTGGFAFVAVANSYDEIVLASNSVDRKTIAASIKPTTDSAETGKFNVFTAPLADGRRLVIATKTDDETGVGKMIDTQLTEYNDLKNQQNSIRQLGMLTLGVLTFLLLFASSWMAFYVARGFTTPIMALAEGADHIAKGELGYRVDTLAEDELETLVNAFNQMSTKLEANSTELTTRRRYIETVLNTLPTGVISVDSGGKISTINPAAVAMLRLGDGELIGAELSGVANSADREIFKRVIARAKRIGHASEQSKLQIEPNDGVSEVSVSLTATALPEDGGVVLVMEDLSELIAAQRASAWREVARRMAHEIKNPLTPIQLSAERIAKRALSEPPALAGGMIVRNAIGTSFTDEADLNSRIIREGTDTILREVQSLKAMVDEFSQFARLPNVELETGNINHVIEQAATLYLDRPDELRLETRIDPVVPETKIDAEQLRRVFVNLIDNAIEAPTGDDAKSVAITSRFDAARDLVIVEVSDNGRGIDPADYQKLFQPYFSTKGRGTGLGLAIVQRIVSEHQGKIKAVPNQPRGAKFIIELPV